MTLEEFIDKEAPTYGGCMLCLARYKANIYDHEAKKEEEKIKEEYMLVERYKIASGDAFFVNKKFYYDYEFAWNEEMPWEVIYKKDV